MKRVFAIITWPFLWALQFATVVVATAIAGKALEYIVSPPPVLIECGLTGVAIPLALLSQHIPLLPASGKWIWVPGFFFFVKDLAYHQRSGKLLEFLREPISANNPVGAAIYLFSLACVLYSLTLVWLDYSKARAARS